jgi:plasmid stabilization system protein ParE
MPRVERDLDRLASFLVETMPSEAEKTFQIVDDALMMLSHHPEIGRRVENGLRELMISRGRTGYVALYVFDEFADEVWVLAVRHQREAGYGLAP